jgi:phenylacetate-CoA ligase
MLNNALAFRQVMSDANLPPSRLKRKVHERLRTVLISAYLHVPYYREMMQRAGYDPIKKYRGPEDLSGLQITNRGILKQAGSRAFVKQGTDLSRCAGDMTSGSTGIPLRVYRAPYERALQMAKWLRVLFMNGYSVRQKVMSLTAPWRLTDARSFVQRLGFLRRRVVNYETPAKDMADLFLTYKPDVLYGNRSHLDILALELASRGMKPRDFQPLVIGTAEVIRENHRKLYRDSFGTELVESYGSVEMGVMAHETPARDGLRLCEDLTYFEFLDKEGNPVAPGEPGRVVVTDLTAKLMPMIRYDQGDYAVHESRDSSDGVPQKRIKRIIGRDDDHALLPDGSLCTFHRFYEVLGKYEDIAQYRIEQRTKSLFRVMVVADPSYLQSVREELVLALEKKFPPGVRLEIDRVDRIEPDASGKTRVLVSEVSDDFEEG